MLRLSTLFLFLSSLLVAQTDIIVRKLILRDAADTKFWELAQDPSDSTTLLLKDEDGNIVVDYDAQDGVRFTGNIRALENIIIKGTNQLQFIDPTETLVGHKFQYGGANTTDIRDSGNNVIWQFRSNTTPDEFLISATTFPGITNTFELGYASFRWKKAWFVDLDISGTCTGCGGGLPVVDTVSIVEGSGDDTKEIRFEVDGFTTGTVRVITPPDTNFKMAGIDITQIFTADQTFTANILTGTDNTYDIGNKTGNRFRWGFAEVWNAPIIEVSDAGGTKQWQIDIHTASTLETLDFHDPSSTVRVTFGNSSTTYSLKVVDDIQCSGAGTCDIGAVSGTRFGIVWGNDFRAGANAAASGRLELFDNNIAGSAVLSGADFSGNVHFKFDANLVPGSSIVDLGMSGDPFDELWIQRLYTPIQSGDLSCSGIADGLMAIQTTAGEIHFCFDEFTYLVPSVFTINTPITVVCGSNEVLVNFTFKNGILIGGVCAAK